MEYLDAHFKPAMGRLRYAAVTYIGWKNAVKERMYEYRLTDREQQIVWKVFDGKLNKEIAWELNISEKHVKNRLTRIFKKSNVYDRTQLVLRFLGVF
jgi:DNA-binding NarL/FixJ family response regulator